MKVWLRYSILVIVFLLLIPSLLGFAALSVTKFKLLKAGTYINALEKNDGYGLIEAHITKNYSSLKLPEGYTKSQIDSSITSVFDYLNGQTDLLELKIDVRPLKQQYLGNSALFMQDSAESKLLPDYIDMAPQFDTSMISQARPIIGIARAGFYGLAILSLALLEAAFLLCATLKGWLRFTGSSFLVSGALLLMPLLVLPGMIARNPKMVQNELAAPLLLDVANDIAQFARAIAFTFMGAGAVVFGLSFFAKKQPTVVQKRKQKKSKRRPSRH